MDFAANGSFSIQIVTGGIKMKDRRPMTNDEKPMNYAPGFRPGAPGPKPGACGERRRRQSEEPGLSLCMQTISRLGDPAKLMKDL